MTSFANAFWVAGDYAAGVSVLFDKLNQGIQENQQFITIAKARAAAEDAYAEKLGDIDDLTERISGGFQRDDGASVKKAYEGVRTAMADASKHHHKIALNIKEMVVEPFGEWAQEHARRVREAHSHLKDCLRSHDKQADVVRTCRSQYYNKCRRVEDLDEEEKLAFQDPQSALTSPRGAMGVPTVKLSEPDMEEDQEPIELGGTYYSPEQMKSILAHILENIPMQEIRKEEYFGTVSRTFQNVSTGHQIVKYIETNMKGTNVDYAERVARDLIDAGFLIGRTESQFANTTAWFYQWTPKAFKLAGVSDIQQGVARSSTAGSGDFGAVTGYLQKWNPLNNQHPNETPAEKLRREARESDEKYKASVRELDRRRCSLEEVMFASFAFMEQYERDRLKAIKTVMLEFSGAISNVIPSLRSTVDNMMLYQETVQPYADLRYLLENYRTGSFVPRVQIYENYYNQVGDQIFGVDLEARARADRRRVPVIVGAILEVLDARYPDLEGDEARRGVWLVKVPLADTHYLRRAVIDAPKGPETPERPERPEEALQRLKDILKQFNVPALASLLKLYLLELPDSLVSSQVYDIIKTIYTTTAPSTDDATRISVIQTALSQLRVANIATLDAILAHFTRLIDLTSADDEYVMNLSTALASCILRPKQENSLTVTEKFNVRLLRDLFANKDTIFGELKRVSSLSAAQAKAIEQRARAVSRDESGRKAAIEEQRRAIQENAKRARSPHPVGPRDGVTGSHRRERSVDTRFPIATNSAVNSPDQPRARAHRQSLDVPQSPPNVGGIGTGPPSSIAQINGGRDSPFSASQADGQYYSASRRGRSETVSIKTNMDRPQQPQEYVASPTQHQSNDGERSARSSVATSTSASAHGTSATSEDSSSTRAGAYPPRHGSTSSISRRGPAAATAAASPADIEKRNSLTRASAARSNSKSSAAGAPSSSSSGFARRTNSSLQRQSLVGQRDSIASNTSVGGIVNEYLTHGGADMHDAEGEEERRGVELVDRPMDD